MLIDTHCHLTSKSNEEIAEIISRAKAADVNKMICIGAGVGGHLATPRAVEIAELFPEVYATAGIHPQDAGKEISMELTEKFAAHPRVVAVGETGLDYYRDWSPFAAQRAEFAAQIAIARNVKKPLVIHSRDALEDTIEILKRERANEVGGVFHCFSGSRETIDRIRDLGFIVSFTGIVTFKASQELRNTIEAMPEGSFMLETDCPYMAPEPFRGKDSEPAHVRQIAERIAQVRGVSLADISDQTTATAKQLFVDITQ